MSALNNSLLLGQEGGGGYAISRSLRFNSSDSAYLSRTPASAGNRQSWSWSGWVKRSTLITGSNRQVLFGGYGASNDTDWIEFGFDYNSTVDGIYWTTSNYTSASAAVFRDVSAWYHVVVNYNGSTLKAFVNSVQVLASSLSGNLGINGAWVHTIGKGPSSSIRYFDGLLADIHFIDGQALDPTSFGEFSATTGVWMPKAYSGSYGTNGFHLPFSDNSTAAALGTDTSGNGNTWTVNNISANTGGPTSVASASGALPVYNTTDTYGTTKGTGTRTDSNSSSIVLAIPMDGANNGTTFTDESATIKGSGSAKSITRNGDSKTSTTQSKFYGSSGAFDGTGDYLTLASSSDFDFGTGDFTIEAWLYLNSLPSGNGYPAASWIVGWGPTESNPGFDFVVGSTNIILAISNFASPTISTAHELSSGKWYHVAATRSGSTARVFVDGVLKGSATTSETASTNPNGIAVSAAEPTGATSGNLNGYLQDLRIYKGVAKYTGNFNPPSSTANATIAAGDDSLVDVPVNGSQTDTGVGGEVRGNYCTWNAVNSSLTLANGNLDAAHGTGDWKACAGTIGVSSGKWYWEVTSTTDVSGSGNTHIGIVPLTYNPTLFNTYIGNTATSYAYRGDGTKYSNNTAASYGSPIGNGTVVGIALDLDAGTLVFYNNGVSQGTAFTSISGTYLPAVSHVTSSTSSANFGQRPFAYTAPSGFKALNTANLPAPVVTKPSTVMDVKLYTGNGSTQTISGLGFSPDLVWIKSRSGSFFHRLYDTIRGTTKALYSNSTDTEGLYQGDYENFTAFNSDGFSLGSATIDDGINKNSSTFAAWAWDAGSSTVTNTQGSITSQVRANPSAGFSVVTYTGNGSSNQTVGHGLGAAPHFIICKIRSGSDNWAVYHRSLGATGRISLNTTGAAFYGNAWDVTPTSSVFTIQTSGEVNGNGSTYVAYCFAPVAGYSSAFSYTGNGSSDGPMCYLGFRPRFIIQKRTDSAGSWLLIDTARDPVNVARNEMFANSSAAEYDNGSLIDVLSNGFKIRASFANMNASGGSFIGFAFAEHPFQYARAR
jgi:hypothetical protein